MSPFCVRCRKAVEMTNIEKKEGTRGEYLSGKCKTCGTNVVKKLKKEDPK